MKYPSLLLLVSALMGCVRIQSNVKNDAVPTFSRILVVTKMHYAEPVMVASTRWLSVRRSDKV